MKEQESKDNPGVIAFPPLIYGGALLIGLVVNNFVPIQFLAGTFSIWLGVLLISVAGPIILSTVIVMRRAQTAFDVRKPATSIVTEGPFRFSRNPAYLALTLLYLGIASLINSIWVFLMVVPAVIVMQRGVIEREERYLERKFGEEYLRFKEQVRRWI